jgi:hypothetical protein
LLKFTMKRTWKLEQIFAKPKPVIGMVHLLPLPGAPAYQAEKGMKGIIAAAMDDALRLIEGGVRSKTKVTGLFLNRIR